MAKKVSRYERLLDTIDRLENNKYTGGLDSGWCADTIVWLWKWRKITREEMESLCDRVTALMECEIIQIERRKSNG